MDNPEAWITELEDICNQTDEIGLTSCMSDDDFMLHFIGNLPEEYKAVFTDLQNRLIAESGEKQPIELMCQKLNVCFKILQSKEEIVEGEGKALAAIKEQIEEKALAAWNK